jgi:hypothetical protein
MVVLFLLIHPVKAQDFRVLVLDALDGTPQVGIEVHYFCEGKGWRASNVVTTNSNGVASVPDVCADSAPIEATLDDKSEKKEECGGWGGETLKQILEFGVISNPSGAGGIWCPTRISKKLKPIPGQVTIFIKKPTWWQSHVAG